MSVCPVDQVPTPLDKLTKYNKDNILQMLDEQKDTFELQLQQKTENLIVELDRLKSRLKELDDCGEMESVDAYLHV